MYIDTDKIVTMTAANQNFSAVARQTDRDGKSVIFKNNRPKYILIDLDDGDYLDLSEEERIDVVARRIMKRHKAAFLELAK
ncbi:MAG: type II toxin-antitoxin system Phd/YefM family antitoxin [Lentisphaerae bacterium]|nr:type II toxin-antitoxin system Phd/YefM family antitoxin [Lentisphaerota bacterium]